ncbi:MAG TPA: hypothetical protein DCG24_08945 [Bacteroidetes bacterium]|nr:hypothetical protein [Bacteroidota bacterium]
MLIKGACMQADIGDAGFLPQAQGLFCNGRASFNGINCDLASCPCHVGSTESERGAQFQDPMVTAPAHQPEQHCTLRRRNDRLPCYGRHASVALKSGSSGAGSMVFYLQQMLVG